MSKPVHGNPFIDADFEAETCGVYDSYGNHEALKNINLELLKTARRQSVEMSELYLEHILQRMAQSNGGVKSGLRKRINKE
jgi:hypothetical protein